MAKKPVTKQAKTDTESIIKKAGKVSEDKTNRRAMRQAIDQGIAEYRKQHQDKVRQQDKKLKKAILDAEQKKATYEEKIQQLGTVRPKEAPKNKPFPWILLGLSWIGFIAFLLLKG